MEVIYLEGYCPEIVIKVLSISYDSTSESLALKADYGGEKCTVFATYLELTENGWVAGISENH